MKLLVILLAVLALARTATGQVLPSEPITLGSGRVVLGGDLAVSFAPQDPGFFNYSDYEHSTLRELRFGLSASVRASDRLSFLGEMRSENFEHLSAFALYARIRPLPERRFDIQIGRVPPTFGAFTRRAYGRDNPLIGYPLAYQYLTSLRSDAVPVNADELLRMRGRGWLSGFSVGDTTEGPGLPLVTSFSWDTGIQVNTGWRAVGVAASVTNGSASNPRVSDDNSGKQIATRVSVNPITGLVIGSSFARGEFLSRRVVSEMGRSNGSDYVQRAHGLDLEYSRDRWMVRSDTVYSQWQMPLEREPLTGGLLEAVAVSLEGRYAFVPGAYAAARAEHLAFNRIAGTRGVVPWEAPVTRYEVGGGYYFQRNLVGRISVQDNRRPAAGRARQATLVAAQVLYWF
jgi:hypothetical protein